MRAPGLAGPGSGAVFRGRRGAGWQGRGGEEEKSLSHAGHTDPLGPGGARAGRQWRAPAAGARRAVGGSAEAGPGRADGRAGPDL